MNPVKFVIEKYGSDCRYSSVKTDQGKPLKIVVRDCPSKSIVKNRYDNDEYPTIIPISFAGKEDFLDKIKEIEDAFLERLCVSETGITRHFETDDGKKIMFCKMPNKVKIRHVSDRENLLTVKKCPKGNQHVDVVIVVDKISLSGDKINITVHAKEIMFLENKDEEDDDDELEL